VLIQPWRHSMCERGSSNLLTGSLSSIFKIIKGKPNLLWSVQTFTTHKLRPLRRPKVLHSGIVFVQLELNHLVGIEEQSSRPCWHLCFMWSAHVLYLLTLAEHISTLISNIYTKFIISPNTKTFLIISRFVYVVSFNPAVSLCILKHLDRNTTNGKKFVTFCVSNTHFGCIHHIKQCSQVVFSFVNFVRAAREMQPHLFMSAR